MVNTVTIPQRYGNRWASVFLLTNEIIAYAFALIAYWVNDFNPGYLYCVLGTIVAGTMINFIFVNKPTPKIADLTNKLSLGVLGMLYVLGMILGRK
jgi:hypothetical protein